MSGFVVMSAASGSAYGQTSESTSLRSAVQKDAYALLDLIEQEFAYADRFPDDHIRVRDELEARIPYLSTRHDLIAFAQANFHALYDHHSITGAGLPDAYGLVPSFADMWIEITDAGYLIEDVRAGSPALAAGIRPGCYLTGIEGQPIEEAVSRFIGPQALVVNDERQSYAARVLTAGRRDRLRRIEVNCAGLTQSYEVPNLYQSRLKRDRGLVSLRIEERDGQRIAVIRFNDSLGRVETIDAFDEALASFEDVDGVVLDMRDTASGGTSLIARGILSRFVDKPTVYQRHILPGDELNYGVVRSWLEEVSPRGHQIDLPVAVVCGRWTGSMGEGLTVAFDSMGVRTFGTRMAGLLGGITDHRLPETGILVKLTTERIQHVDGTPRETYVPFVNFNFGDAPGEFGEDGPMESAVGYIVGQLQAGQVVATAP